MRTRSLAAIAVLSALAGVLVVAAFACRSGGPRYGGGSLINPTTVTDWYFASVAAGGSDGNGCGATNPCVTISGGMIPKLGTTAPAFGGAGANCLTVTLHIQNTETVGQELALLTPKLIGTCTTLAIVGTPTVTVASFDAGTITARSQTNPGSQLTIASMPSGAAAGMIVKKLTQFDGGTYTASAAMIQSMNSTTATMDQPQTLAPMTTVSMSPTPVEDNTWATSDQFSLSTVPILNLESIDITGGDTDLTNGGLFITQVEIPDQSSEAGKSNWRMRAGGGSLVATLTKFDPKVIVDMSGTPATASIIGSQFTGGVTAIGNVTFSGGSIISGASTFQGNGETLQNGFAIGAAVSVASGTLTVGDVTCATANTISILDGTVVLTNTGFAWGACTINAAQPNTAFLSQGDATALVWAMLISSKDAGSIYKFDGGNQDNISATPGLLDTNGAIFSPTSGARITH